MAIKLKDTPGSTKWGLMTEELGLYPESHREPLKNFKQDLQFTKMSVAALWKMNWRKLSKGVERLVMHVGLRPGLDFEKWWVGNSEVSGFRGRPD